MEENTKSPLTIKIEDCLEKIRPFLQREGGDIRLDHFDDETGTAFVTMTGACNGCYMAEGDVNDSISVLLMDEIPEVKRVELIQPEEMSFEDMLKRLQAEEKANQELEEFNRTHKDNQ